jgi:hypothetical protein
MAAKIALAEARHQAPQFTAKGLTDSVFALPIPNLFDGLRKAGLPEE